MHPFLGWHDLGPMRTHIRRPPAATVGASPHVGGGDPQSTVTCLDVPYVDRPMLNKVIPCTTGIEPTDPNASETQLWRTPH